MTAQNGGIESLRKQINYYKRQVDELAAVNLRLDYTVSGLQRELKQRRQGFALLSALQQTIGVNKEISAIFEIAIQAINTTLGMDRTVVLSQTEDEDCFMPSQWFGFHSEASGQFSSLSIRFPPEFRKGTGLLVVNKTSEPTPLGEEIRRAFGLPYFVCLPVMVDDAPIGLVLSGRLKEVRPLYPPLDHGDVDTFQAIAGLISASVRNLRLAVFKEMDRLKTEFFANISHEFRTPLTLTLGPLEGILKERYGEISDALRGQLLVMQRNQERLLALINQILDLSKLEMGGMRLKAAPMPDMNRFIEERIGQFRMTAKDRSLELKLSLDPRVGELDLHIDREQFDKLLSNLLSNALKFTERGHVEVSSGVREEAFRLTVADTGMGIKQDQLPHIFDRFRQADGSESRQYSGTGIGLALVKEIANLHGGDVTVQSQYGKGSVFRVIIPAGTAHLDPAFLVDFADDAPASRAGSGSGIVVDGGVTGQEGIDEANREAEAVYDKDKPTILYAEDNADLRVYMRDFLRPRYNVFVSGDGREAFDKARTLRPDLILTDQMMPHMSGSDLLRAIRGDPDLRSTPVIFLTARAGTEARIESLEAEANDYIAKPFDEAEVQARIENLLRARAQERELAQLNRRLETKIEEQVAELVHTGELKRFLSPAVVESVLEGKVESYRRKITVLFADMVGFTSLTDSVEPEELYLLLNDFLREMTAVSVARGGTVLGFSGDALMVIFGAPKHSAEVDQAWATVNTALAMREQMNAQGAQWRRRGISHAVGVRIGINTGFCTVGIFGSELLQTYTAYGTPVNVASRLMGEVSAGGILCSLSTYALFRDRVRAKELGPLALRGIAHPIEAYEILGLLDAEALAEGETAG